MSGDAEVPTGPEPDRLPTPPEDGPPSRALLVEDEPVVGELLAEFLALEGYEVDRAIGGREALELVRRQAYAIIVSDVRMPDVDGPAFYRELRTVRPEMTRRMVFVTGDIMSAETRRFLEETSLRYLAKPFTIAAFRAAVQSVLPEPPSTTTPPAAPAPP